MSEPSVSRPAEPPIEWFAESDWGGLEQRIQLRARLWEGRSEYQHIEIVDTVPFGRALILDGALQTTEADEFCYHELLVHIPLLAHPAPRRVLIIGGGDGGCLRHVLMHGVESVVQVEIDEQVVRACAEWLPGLADGAFDDPRARLVIGDGLAYLREAAEGEPFDVILTDSTDPVGPAEGLISEQFYRSASSALAPEGMLAVHSGSPLLMRQAMWGIGARIANVFPVVGTYLGQTPAYPWVVWSFTVGSKRLDPRQPRRPPPPNTRYYTPDVHQAAFALPAYLHPPPTGTRHDVSADPGPVLG